MPKLGIYIHWPFCLSKCPYCDFFSMVKKDVSQSELINEYIKDLEFYRSLNDDYVVESIFFGGGTPSLIEPQHVEKLIDTVGKLWSTGHNPEISLEANPNTNQPNLFKDLRSAGINRLSLGVQALNDKDLAFLGRTHNLHAAERAIAEVLHTFDNHSMDLIYARPNQTGDEWADELAKACGLGFRHLSLYQLTIEENTMFGKQGVKPPDEENAAGLYQISEDITANYGYQRYEISNYAKSGFACRHNLGYWFGDDYVGVGKGAVGYIHHHGKLFTTAYPRKMEEVSPTERAEELLIMGMRLDRGVEKQKVMSAINHKHLAQLKADGLVMEDDKYLSVSPKGRLLLDYVIARLSDAS